MSEQEDCTHAEDDLAEAVAHIGEAEWAFCYGCMTVLHDENGEWVPQKT